ncbi:MAG: 16S rRNA (uracil(1498)-N(3))-methyltransferase [Eubacteriales bacterium]|nr:16S rRNA (uracil(1498)-N(3))-methyltransferase [Eubacteriales bacterium]
MLHLFVDPSAIQGDTLLIEGADCNHIKNVLRMRPGEELSVSNGADGKEYRYGIEAFTPDGVLCRLRFVKEADVELPVKVYLFQGLPKADKMEWIVQKCVELGVYEVIPVAMERCVVKLDAAKGRKKTQRWQTIAESAAGQSRRGIVPQVREPMTMREALDYAERVAGCRIIPYELQEGERGTRDLFRSLTPGGALAVFIGPEGGFTPQEVEAAAARGVRPISLGRRILRTETAGMTVLSWVIYETEIE